MNGKINPEHSVTKEKTMIKLCIFDLDGTVLDTIHTISHYGNYALARHGIAPIEAEEYKYLVGTGMVNLIKKMLNFRECYSEDLFERVLHDYDEAYNADVSYKTKIFDGLLQVLDEFKAMGLKLAIVSNKPDYPTRLVINKLYGDGYFEYVTGKRDGVPLKPDPTVVFDVMKRFEVSADECVYVGDTATDMHTGKNAGIYTVGVLWGFRGEDELRESGADAIVSTPDELYSAVTARAKEHK